MLFNSYVFVLAFLPIVYLSGLWLARRAPLAVYFSWLVLASIVFYSWQDVRLGVLFCISILFNYFVGLKLTDPETPFRRAWLSFGVGSNLALIGYFKYLGFSVGIANSVFGTTWSIPAIALPLGISFYTFQQIAYLVDAYRGEVHKHGLIDYALFVSFFPQLIAGPIVQHGDVLDQFAKSRARRFSDLDFSVGMTYFSIGLFKKVVLADQFALFANPAFALAEQDRMIPWGLAWIGMLSYALQLYFDFSGYSDMALGLGRLFGIQFPLNFNSPYQAVDIIDFWRRWHMTLSAFLRDYLYIPLGGNRCVGWRKSWNLLLTMLLGGLWHGAGWTFVLWGGVHGLLLILNHAWNRWCGTEIAVSKSRLIFARFGTFLIVSLAWVLFRAESLTGAGRMYAALLIPNLQGLDYATWFAVRDAGYWLPLGLAIVWYLPNSQQFLGRIRPALNYRWRVPHAWWQWQPTVGHALFSASLFVAAFCTFSRVSHFIYFNF